MGALIALLISSAPSIINMVEGAFKGKQTSGPDKLDLVTNFLKQLSDKMVSQAVPLPDGSVPTKKPDDNMIVGLVETVLNDMKSKGTLVGSPPPPVSSTSTPTPSFPVGMVMFIPSGPQEGLWTKTQ